MNDVVTVAELRGRTRTRNRGLFGLTTGILARNALTNVEPPYGQRPCVLRGFGPVERDVPGHRT